ncbi:hypothetical protein LTS14_003442 [Recurvomyces mirabilis]|uniref:uncharacterized protein n=1 Tax=Recurvomyces mirabilis TaxID=574656 RepID=UPI002DDDEAAC|nr:hypothetical protein LTS14_003442 [Recurvomyces mirabilis]
MSTTALPDSMQALILNSTSEPPIVQTVPVPQVTPGTAIVRVLVANIISYTRHIYNGDRKYPFPTPLIPGSSAIGRIVSLPSDATRLQLNDLVFIDCIVRSRDEPTDIFLAAIVEGGTPGSAKLMRDVYRDWTYAEYCRAPIENLIPLNERTLLGSPKEGGLGYTTHDLAYLAAILVPYGGLRGIRLEAGETVVVAPATGPFGGAAVLCALAMGARVLALGRNTASLAKLKERAPYTERLYTVPLTNDPATDLAALQQYGEIDIFFDIGPPEAAKSTHIKTCILSLRHGGRVSLMGGYHEDIPVPHRVIMHRNLTLKGKWMCERDDIFAMLKLVETGMLPLGKKGGVEVTGTFPLGEWKEAWDLAAEKAGFGEYCLLCP